MSGLFVSYAHADSLFVYELRTELIQSGYDVWLDVDEVDPSADWLVSVERALASAEAVVFVVSPSFLRSEMCLHELRQAVAQGKQIVSITLDGVENEHLPDEFTGAESIYVGDRTDLSAVLRLLGRTL